jgi:glycosyltransferase involved in cell wall biosynthesis
MHICFIGEFPKGGLYVGGISTFLKTMADELVGLGCRVSIISFSTSDTGWTKEGMHEVYRIHPSRWSVANFVSIARETNKILKQIHQYHPIDIVEVPENGLAFIKKFKGPKFVIRLHGGHVFFANSTADTPFNFIKAFTEKRSLKKADAIIGVSKYVLETTAQHFPFLLTKKTKVIYNPIVLERFYAADSAKKISGRILFFGSLTEKKGIRQLIEAMPFILKKFPTVSLQVYGRDIALRPSGKSFKTVLEATIQRLDLNNVTIHPALPNHEMPAIIESAEVVVLPSHMEAMPLAWLEAMAMEKPFIAGKPGPGPEVIEHKKNGLLCNPLDPEDIADKICYMLEHSTEAYEMGKQARKDIIASFGATYLAQKNMEFFQSL